jgi:DNA-binding Lrp family transcriptional regulator
MFDDRPASGGPLSPVQSARIAGRHAVTFVMQQAIAGGEGGHFLERLIFVAIVQANVSHLDRDQDLQRAYSAYDHPPPDELRRPVSVSAISRSLRLPYETTRRRVQHLAERGDCVVTERGVVAPYAALLSPSHLALLQATYRNVQALYLKLRALGVLRDPPARAVTLAGPAPLRAVARISADYVLRIVEILTQHVGDLVRGLILLDILRANTEHLSDLDFGPDAATFVSDARRRPVTVIMLARRLNIPVETVRRHVRRLSADGRCSRRDGGLIISAEALAAAPWPQLTEDNLGHLNWMFSALAPLGLLAEWDEALSSVA